MIDAWPYLNGIWVLFRLGELDCRAEAGVLCWTEKMPNQALDGNFDPHTHLCFEHNAHSIGDIQNECSYYTILALWQ